MELDKEGGRERAVFVGWSQDPHLRQAAINSVNNQSVIGQVRHAPQRERLKLAQWE